VADFWSLLKAGTDAVGEIPDDRWDVDAYFHPDPASPGKMYTRAGSSRTSTSLMPGFSGFRHAKPGGSTRSNVSF
jgi:hypothetical protein